VEYICLLSTASADRAFFETDIYPPADYACTDLLEVALSAADRWGMKVFVSNGFFCDWTNLIECFSGVEAARRRRRAMEQLAARYGHHPSFYGWYLPDESELHPIFEQIYVNYVNQAAAWARELTPGAKVLIAPYGTNKTQPDDGYAAQLDGLDVDIIAYQDEVGVEKTRVDQSAAYFEGLRRVHDRVGRVALWADVEVFRFEGPVYRSALLPADFARVERQLAAVSPFVDNILIYQYLGMMSKPGSTAAAGHPDAQTLYRDYAHWLAQNHPDRLLTLLYF
jgi:hypothetical protein